PMEAHCLLPVQNATGVVVSSTKTGRMLVSLGRKYSTVWLVLGSSRTTRSVVMPPVQISPFLSTTGIVRPGPRRRQRPFLEAFFLGVEHADLVAAVFRKPQPVLLIHDAAAVARAFRRGAVEAQGERLG